MIVFLNQPVLFAPSKNQRDDCRHVHTVFIFISLISPSRSPPLYATSTGGVTRTSLAVPPPRSCILSLPQIRLRPPHQIRQRSNTARNHKIIPPAHACPPPTSLQPCRDHFNSRRQANTSHDILHRSTLLLYGIQQRHRPPRVRSPVVSPATHHPSPDPAHAPAGKLTRNNMESE